MIVGANLAAHSRPFAFNPLTPEQNLYRIATLVEIEQKMTTGIYYAND